MRRGKALVIKSTERDYRVLDASRRPIPGLFTHDEAIAKAKANEAWMKEQGFPRSTKHYVIYQPTGENVPFDGATMAKRRKRRSVNLGSSKQAHIKMAATTAKYAKAALNRAGAAMAAGKCSDALTAMLNTRHEIGQAQGHYQGIRWEGESRGAKAKLEHALDKMDAQLFTVSNRFRATCLVKR